MFDLDFNQVAAIPLVAQAYLNADAQVVVVELQIVPQLGLANENFLFFSVDSFSAQKVRQAIRKVRKKAGSTPDEK